MTDRLGAALARRIRVVALDVDGVLTDNGIYLGRAPSGERVELKRFGIEDGLGIKMLRWAGLGVALISARESEATRLRAEELGVECFQDASGRKLEVVEALLERHGATWEEAAFVGDDLADLPVLRRVALPVAVANAALDVKAAARWQTRLPGGAGAVREFAEELLRARGEWGALVDAYCREREGAEAADAG
ncbi:MAG TPA: HAD hydrolase family protein [Longimicrobiales bacterium]